MILTRRNALRGLFLAAPAIVAAPSLMRVSAAAFKKTVQFEEWEFPSRYPTVAMWSESHGQITYLSESGEYFTFDARTGKPLDTVADYRALSNG